MSKQIALIICLCILAQTQAFWGHFKQYPPPPPNKSNVPTFWGHLQSLPPAPEENKLTAPFFDQILDHFNATDKRTWLQRYWVNWEHYKSGGPSFIYIEAESE